MQQKDIDIDLEAMSAEMRESLRGDVRFRLGDRALYATDSSNYRQMPLGMVAPRAAEDLVAALAICRKHGAPIVSRGGGTSLAGQGCNAGVVFDFSKYMCKVLEVDPKRRLARVQPGAVCDYVQAAARPHGLRFGPDPSTHYSCSFGGMIGNNSCGVHSVLSAFAGTGPRVSDNLRSMRVLTYDGVQMEVGPNEERAVEASASAAGRRGEIYARLKRLRDEFGDEVRARFPKIPRRVSGYNLDELLPENKFHLARALAGTEGTCAVILEATVDLIEQPAEQVLVVLGFEDIYSAGDAVSQVMSFRPDACEGMDDLLMLDMRRNRLHVASMELLPKGKGWLLVEFGGASLDEAIAKAEKLKAAAEDVGAIDAALYSEPEKQEGVWLARESGLGATARVPLQTDAWEGWEDSAVPPERLGDYLRELKKLYDKFGYVGPFYGHFGQGLVHTRITFDLKSKAGIDQFRLFIRQATELVAGFGGVPSGEHGDGQSKAEFLETIYGAKLMEAFREFKRIWDPELKMNPGKVVDPYRVDENLRMGPSYRPAQPETNFKFPEDKGSFSYAVERCVGVGKCRQTEGGTMCPSYMATREEMHSTRGRAHLLFEMLNESALNGKNRWKNEETREALSLCLACKACKAECPVNVDMATYKAEFYSHYYKGRLRERAAYSMGLIYWWARIASKMPRVANFFSRSKPFATALKWAGGVAPERSLPQFASPTFRDWFSQREKAEPKREGRERIILWPDTFNNYLTTDAARAATRVLEAAGFEVTLPPRPLCCGRPLYDFGFLDRAKALLEQIMEALRPELQDGVKIVGLEPSCVAVFRDELVNLFPNDEDARRLSRNTLLLSEFLQQRAEDWEMPQLKRRALAHRHCHHHAIMGFDAEEAVLKRLGLDYEILDSGCCGMAGSFGFEKRNYAVSKACADRVLVPRVEKADEETLILTDGFSCREQIEQLVGRKPLHLAEVIEMAMASAEAGAASPPAVERR